MPIHKLDDAPNQSGYWYYLEMNAAGVEEIRVWLKKNCGAQTRMSGSISTGWEAKYPDRKWTIMRDNMRFYGYKGQSCSYLVFWDKSAAALFSIHFTPDGNGTIYPVYDI